MGGQWYVGREDQRFGPYSAEQLRTLVARGQVRLDDRVWKEGMPNWLRLEEVSNEIGVDQATSGSAVNWIERLRTWANYLPQRPVLIAVLLMICFPIGLVAVWWHHEWSLQRKLTWTGVWVVLLGIGLLAGDSPQMTIDADFLPHKVGAVARYDTTFSQQDVGMEMKCHYRENGIIEKETTFLVGHGVRQPYSGTRKQERWAVRDGYVLIGAELSGPGHGLTWQRVLKLGATVGDTWEDEQPGYRYEVVGFHDWTLPYDGSTRRCVTIKSRFMETEVEQVYAKGIGLISQTAVMRGVPGRITLVTDRLPNMTAAERAFFE